MLAYARKLRTLNESALPIVPTGTMLSARGFKFQVLHSFFYGVAAIISATPAAAVFSLPNRNAPSTHIRSRMAARLRAAAMFIRPTNHALV